MEPRLIKLSQIRVESSFRNENRDESLELSLNKEGQRVPIIVEKEGNGQYVLVEGYRRYNALISIGKKKAQCIVEEVTSEEQRLIKRLDIEFHTEKRNAYQLEKMINQLLKLNKHDAKSIAKLCNVTEETVRKYLKGREVNPDWVRRGEQANVGRHGLTDIHTFQNVGIETKEYILDLYIGGQINGTSLGQIKEITKVPVFKDISEEDKKECIDEVIIRGIKDKEVMSEIVSNKRLEISYDETSLENITNLIVKLLYRVNNLLRKKHYVNYLAPNQRLNIQKLLEGSIVLLNIKNDLPYNTEEDISTRVKQGDDDSVEKLEH